MDIYEILKCIMYLWELKKKIRILVFFIMVYIRFLYICVYLLIGFYNVIK